LTSILTGRASPHAGRIARAWRPTARAQLARGGAPAAAELEQGGARPGKQRASVVRPHSRWHAAQLRLQLLRGAAARPRRRLRGAPSV